MFSLITKQICKAPLSRHSSLLAIPQFLYFLLRCYIVNTNKKNGPSEEKKEGSEKEAKGKRGEEGEAKEKPVTLSLIDRFWFTSS